jgi:uncharacterized protein YndB with AHSA1/START domain
MNKTIRKSNRPTDSQVISKDIVVGIKKSSKPSFAAKRPSKVANTATSVKTKSTEKHIVRKSVQLKATPSEVWDALTNPEKTKKYFFNCEAISDWKVGSPIRFKGRIWFFFKIEFQGEIIKIEADKILKYTLKNEGKKGEPASTSTVTDTLTYADGITTLSITDDVGNTPGAEVRYDKSMKGWDKILGGLKKVVEKR